MRHRWRCLCRRRRQFLHGGFIPPNVVCLVRRYRAIAWGCERCCCGLRASGFVRNCGINRRLLCRARVQRRRSSGTTAAQSVQESCSASQTSAETRAYAVCCALIVRLCRRGSSRTPVKGVQRPTPGLTGLPRAVRHATAENGKKLRVFFVLQIWPQICAKG